MRKSKSTKISWFFWEWQIEVPLAAPPPLPFVISPFHNIDAWQSTYYLSIKHFAFCGTQYSIATSMLIRAPLGIRVTYPVLAGEGATFRHAHEICQTTVPIFDPKRAFHSLPMNTDNVLWNFIWTWLMSSQVCKTSNFWLCHQWLSWAK